MLLNEVKLRQCSSNHKQRSDLFFSNPFGVLLRNWRPWILKKQCNAKKIISSTASSKQEDFGFNR